jgi:hypothetical protein
VGQIVNKNRRMEMDEEEKKELTREERTRLAASIAKKIEDAMGNNKPDYSKKGLIELVAKLIFPNMSVKLILE